MTIYFEPHEFTRLNYRDYDNKANKKGFLKRLEESMSLITFAERCGVELWKMKKLIELHGLEGTKLIKRCFVHTDLHFPNEDKEAYELSLKFLKQYKPDIYINLGDVDDCDSLSDHNKNKKRLIDFGARKNELDHMNKRFDELYKILPKRCKKIITVGNHGIRAWRVYERQPQYEGLLDIISQCNLVENKWHIYPEGCQAKVGNLHMTHSTYCNLHTSAKSCDFGVDLMYGHLHTQQVYTKYVAGKTITAQCVGGMQDESYAQIAYLNGKPVKWILGFATVEIDLITGNHGGVHFYPIKDNMIIKEGYSF